MTGIAEMFAELDGYDRLSYEIDAYAAVVAARRAEYAADPWNRRQAVQRTMAWRLANPERYREHKKREDKLWRARNPDKVREFKRRYRERNRDKVRESWRRNTAAYRARKAAQS